MRCTARRTIPSGFARLFGITLSLGLAVGCGNQLPSDSDRPILSSTITETDSGDYTIEGTPQQGSSQWTFSLERRGRASGDELRFEWDFGDGSAYSGETQTFTYTSPGLHRLTVRGYDRRDKLALTLFLHVDVQIVNDPPVADAGTGKTAFPNGSIFLDGSDSHDPNGDEITLQWSQIAGDQVNLIDSDTAFPRFVAPTAYQDTQLVFKLEVSDGMSVSESSVTVDVITNLNPAESLPECEYTLFIDRQGSLAGPLDGLRPLTVSATAFTFRGEPLDDPSFTWSFDGVQEIGTVDTHSKLSRMFESGGIHTIALSISVNGVSVDCVSARTGRAEEYVAVWPIIEGHVVDSSGAPMPGITVSANAGGTTTITNTDGRYRVHVPDRWTGDVAAQHVGFSFSPTPIPYFGVDRDWSAQDYAASTQLNGCTVAADCDDGLFCNGAETCLNGTCEPASQPCGDGETCDDLNATCLPLRSGCMENADCDDGPAARVVFVNGAEATIRQSNLSVVAARYDLRASLEYLGDSQWELTIRNGASAVAEVWFPWEPTAVKLNDQTQDDVVYYPRLTGVAFDNDALPNNEWQGIEYPGPCFAPLVLLADDQDVRMVAATNWPPRPVEPSYSRSRLALRYRERIAPNATRAYRALIVGAKGDASVGRLPWHVAIDGYREWLISHMRAEGLYPIQYPEAMRRCNGWIHLMLVNSREFDQGAIDDLWERWGNTFGWIQFWGQMSNYFEPPKGRGPRGAVPPLTSGEKVGCCLAQPEMHGRYRPSLPAFARRTSQSALVSYYARPKPPYKRLDGADREALQFVVDWLKKNQQYGANAFYIDVLGARNFGDPLAIAKMFGSEFPRMSVIEFAVDVYPTAYLISGSLWGGYECRTLPRTHVADLGADQLCVTFPRLGRYLLNDRIMFLGESNGDHSFWGHARGFDHWTERQAFLLGAKFDAKNITDRIGGRNEMNLALREIIAEWERVGWWDRDPIYLDQTGIGGLPATVDVRRFRDREGINLFVIDNWQRARGATFRFGDQTLEIPERRLAILEHRE